MAKLPIKALCELGKKHRMSHVIVLAHDGKQDHVATWGQTIEQCSQAANFGNTLKEMLGWPANLCDAQPSRVQKLQVELKTLEECQKKALDYIEQQCSACRDCDGDCPGWVVKRLLRGEPTAACFWCGEYEHDLEKGRDDQMTCSYCRNADSHAEVIENKGG